MGDAMNNVARMSDNNPAGIIIGTVITKCDKFRNQQHVNCERRTCRKASATAIAITSSQVTNFAGSVGNVIAQQKAFFDVGNGVLTTIPVAHGLNTLDVIIQLFDNATGETVNAGVARISPTDIELTFTTAPAPSAIRVLMYAMN